MIYFFRNLSFVLHVMMYVTDQEIHSFLVHHYYFFCAALLKKKEMLSKKNEVKCYDSIIHEINYSFDVLNSKTQQPLINFRAIFYENMHKIVLNYRNLFTRDLIELFKDRTINTNDVIKLLPNEPSIFID